MTYYVETSSMGRCGCRRTSVRKIEAPTKTAIRKKYRGTGVRVEAILTEEDLEALGAYGERIRREAY